MTPADVRKLALGLPEAEEKAHFGKADFRVRNKIFASLPDDANRKVRRLQREYLREWQQVLRSVHPEIDDREAQTRLLATVGLLNSTPHSAKASGSRAAAILAGMARAALVARVLPAAG